MMYFYPNDRRKHMRILINYSVICYVDHSKRGLPVEGLEAITARTYDISEGGVSIITYQPLEPKTHLRIKFIMSGNTNERLLGHKAGQIIISGDASYSLPLGEGKYRIGICFSASEENIEDKFFRLLCTQY